MKLAQLAALLAVFAALAFVPNLQDATGFAPYYLIYGYFVFFWIAQATSWNILSGYSGYFSFGQGAFYGLGVYAAGDLGTKTLPQVLGVPHGMLVFGVVLMAVGGFAGASWVEKKMAAKAAPAAE